EDGIRDGHVTGVQTCALPIFLLGIAGPAFAQSTLRVGDQKGNAQAVMEAAGVLRDVPYKIEWKEFPAAAPLLEALSAGAIETGRSEERRVGKEGKCGRWREC